MHADRKHLVVLVIEMDPDGKLADRLMRIAPVKSQT
jgi:hypothetical protein